MTSLIEPSVPLTRNTFYAGGRWVAPNSTRKIEIVSPSTGEIVGAAPDCDETDVDIAVQGARNALEDPQGWSSWAPARRADQLIRLAEELDKRVGELSVLQAHQIGRPVSSGGGNRPGEILRYFAELGRNFTYQETRESPNFRGAYGLSRSTINWETRGVTAAISPYNGTLNLGLFKIAPTLAAGGTAVLKPPPQSPLDAYVFAEAIEAAGLPAGVVSVLPGGRETGEALVRHKGIDIVGFTGSTSAGRFIAKECAELLRPVVLELGGKSAAVILQDADLDAFEKSLPFIGFTFTGQNCFIHSRIIVVESLYEEVVERSLKVAKDLRLGDPFDTETLLGPLISSEHREFVMHQVKNAVNEGAQVVTGGGIPKELDSQGWYFEPTIIRDVTATMDIAQSETFGPVLSVLKAENEQHAIELANQSSFGLGGSVWTKNYEKGLNLARQIDSGSVGINGFGFNTAAPFECRKDSGLGVELGEEGFKAYLQPHVTHHFGVNTI